MKLTFAIKLNCFINHCTRLVSYCEDLFYASKFNYVPSLLNDSILQLQCNYKRVSESSAGALPPTLNQAFQPPN
jgi:hypothetical protein